MLYAGETFNQRKRLILEDIKRSRESIKLYQSCAAKFPNQRDGWNETIQLERGLYDQYVQDLIELKKWRNKIGIGEDEPYELQRKKSE